MPATVHRAKDMDFRKGKPERSGETVRQADGFSIANYQDRKHETWDISLWQQDLIVDVSFQTKKKQPYGSLDAKAFADKLESLVKAAIQKGPTAPMRHIYPEPFASKFKDPCDVASTEASQMERHPESALQADALCRRHNIAPEASLDKENYRVLEASLRMWDKPQAAIDRNAYQCDPADKHPFGPPVAITSSLGTGQTCMSNIQIDWVLDFQLGDVNVSLQGDHGGTSSTQPAVEGLRDELLPAQEASYRREIPSSSGKRASNSRPPGRVPAWTRSASSPATELLALAHDVDRRGWWQRTKPTFNERVRTLLNLEKKADLIVTYECMNVPGVIQLPDYTEHLPHECELVPTTRSQTGWAIRARRHEILARPQPTRSQVYATPGTPQDLRFGSHLAHSKSS